MVRKRRWNYQNVGGSWSFHTIKTTQMFNRSRKIEVDPTKWKEEYGSFEHTLLLFITDRCNLYCEGCFNNVNMNGRRKYSLGDMSAKYVAQLVDSNPNVNDFDVMGGEPLLHPNFESIMKVLQERGKNIGIFTNGYYLDRLRSDYTGVKIQFSFQTIDERGKSLKSIARVADKLKIFEGIYPLKLTLLMNSQNRLEIPQMVQWVEDNFIMLDKITIGAVRNEADYWNDNYDYVVPFEEYGDIVQDFVDNYRGRLDLDIFSKGFLYTDKMPQNQPHQLGRFKCIYPRAKYALSLYHIARGDIGSFDHKFPFDFNNPEGFMENNGRELTDKIRLINLRKNNNADKLGKC